MQSAALSPSLTETTATYKALLDAECCLAQKALTLTNRFHCGTDCPEDWRELYRMRAFLKAVRLSLDKYGNYWTNTITFSGDIPGCQLQVKLQDYGLGLFTLVEGDTPGVVDLEKSVQQYAATLAEILHNTLPFNAGLPPWDGDWPLAVVCADGDTITVWLHPYLATYVPDGEGFTPNVGDWKFSFGPNSNCTPGPVQATALNHAFPYQLPGPQPGFLDADSSLPGAPVMPRIAFVNVVVDPTKEILIGVDDATTLANFITFFASPSNVWFDYIDLTSAAITNPGEITANWQMKPFDQYSIGAAGDTWRVIANNSFIDLFTGGYDGTHPASAIATDLQGGEFPLGIQTCCATALQVKQMFAAVQAYCRGCDAENTVPDVYYNVTGSDKGCCGCFEGDMPEINAIFIR